MCRLFGERNENNMRITGKSVDFGVCWLLRCVAAVLAALMMLGMGVPSAWGVGDAGDSLSGPTVDLHVDQKTDVKADGDVPTYKLGKATVTGGASSYIVVQVDTGSFTPNVDAPTGAKAEGALNASGAYVDGGAKKDSVYTYASFKSTDGNASVTAENVQTYLRGLTFTLSGGQEQTVTVNVVNQTMKASYNDKQYDVTLFNGNAYTFVENTDKSNTWAEAYKAAKQTTFLGKKGHLLTVDSSSEHNLIYKSFGGKAGFMGATRYTTAEQAAKDEDTFEPYASANEQSPWYWVTGPSAGTMILTKGTVGAGGTGPANTYTNWNAGEPNASGSNKEGYGEYGLGSTGQWNDVANDGTYGDNGTRYANGYYVEFESVNLNKAGAAVSAATQCVDVSYDLDDGKVASVSAVSKILTNGDYETTLSVAQPAQAAAAKTSTIAARAARAARAAVPRELDVTSVKVSVGGEELSRGADGYSFVESTGKLTIPAAKVTGAVKISAKVKRQVTITDDKGAEQGVLSLAYNAQLDKSEADKLAAKSGYTVSGYKKSDADYELSSPVTDDMTLAAVYALDAPTVTINSNKSQLETKADKASVSVEVTKPVAGVTEKITWTKDGQELSECAGKTTCEIGEAGTYKVEVTETDSEGKTSKTEKTVEIKAPTVRTVTVKNGDTTQEFPVSNGDPLGADNVAGMAKQGYTLSGWQTEDGKSFDPATTPVTGSMTISPVWTLNKPTVENVTASPSKIESVGDKTKIATSVTPPSVEGGQVTTSYRWYKDGALIDGATGASFETTEPGTYKVEVTVTDPATGETSTAVEEVTVAAPDNHTVTIINGDGTPVTVEVPNGGTVDTSALSQVKKDGYEVSGWVKADGTPFDPSTDKLTADMTISPVWKLAEPAVEITVDRDTVQVKVDNPAGAKVEYLWFMDGKLLSGQTGATLVGAQPGVYTVRITLTDADGNTVTVERQVTVEALASTGAVFLPAALVVAVALLAGAAFLALARRQS